MRLLLLESCFKNSFESNALALKLLCRSTCNMERCHGNNRDGGHMTSKSHGSYRKLFSSLPPSLFPLNYIMPES